MMQATSKTSTKGAEPFLEKFRRFESEPQQPAWLLPLRKAGMARFAELGFPTVHDEDWRFTNIAPLAKLPFKPAVDSADEAAKTALEKYVFAHLPGSRLVFVNGHFHAALSSVGKLRGGVKVTSLAAALKTDSAFIEQQLGRLALTDDNSFAALNQAFFLDGGFVHIPANQSVEEPVQLVFVSTTGHSGDTIQPRNLIIAGAS